MKTGRLRHAIVGFGLIATVVMPNPVGAADPDWKAVEQALGKAGQLQPGDVFRIGIPRTDLAVTVKGVPVKAPFALYMHFWANDQQRKTVTERPPTMHQEVTPIPVRPWTLNGLSERLIVSHYEDNYGAAVRTLNAVRGELAGLDAGAPGYRLRALKREELIAMGSVTLHELY